MGWLVSKEQEMCSLAPYLTGLHFYRRYLMLSHWFDPRSIHLSLCLLRSRPQTSRDGGVSVQAHSHMSSLSSVLNCVLGLLHSGYLWAGTCSCSLPRISTLFGLDTLFCLASSAPTRNLFSQGQILSTCEKILQLLWCRVSSLVRRALWAGSGVGSYSCFPREPRQASHPCPSSWN